MKKILLCIALLLGMMANCNATGALAIFLIMLAATSLGVSSAFAVTTDSLIDEIKKEGEIK